LATLTSPVHAQEEAGDGKTQVVPKSPGSVEVRLSKDARSTTLIVTRELEEFLSKAIQVHYKNSDTWPTHFVLQTLLVTPSGKTIGQCTSKAVALVPGKPGRFPDVCFQGSLTKGLNELGVETLTVEETQWVDGKPVNLGLWARENLDESSFVLSVEAVPENPRVAEIVEGGTLLLALKYPIEHGV